MPELPEVETIRIGLSALLPKLRIKSVDHNWPKSFPNAPADVDQFLVGARISQVRRRAKVLIIDLDSDYSLVIHLKMTGQLVFVGEPREQFSVVGDQLSVIAENRQLVTDNKTERFGAGHPNDSLVGDLPDKSTRVILTFQDGSKLFFNDQRKFGWVRLLPTLEVENLDFFKKVGPEPLSTDFTPDDFVERLMRRKNSGIKAVLLDQTVIAGVGNIYADESLWAAKIHPETKVRSCTRNVLVHLYEELRRVLRLSIEKGGSTDRNYVNHEGKRGSYLAFANVFRREGQPCPRCGTTIIKTRVAGRGTHLCPVCQKAGS
jgi:formamidopyrimidine-DNA glycosylase